MIILIIMIMIVIVTNHAATASKPAFIVAPVHVAV
jgi:hypothetical protein